MRGPRLVLLLGAVHALATPALAQPTAAPTAAAVPAATATASATAGAVSDADRALALGHKGLELYNKGNWAEAQAQFQAAEKLAHSPVFGLYLGRCARNAGDVTTAITALARVASEVLPADAPAPWASAVASAKAELEELQKRYPDVHPLPSGEATVPVPTASAPPTASVAAPPTATASGSLTAAPTALADEPGPLAPGLVVLAQGVVGIGLGIGLFAHAKSVADAVLAGCNGVDCRPEDLPRKGTAVDFANGATAAFVGGGVSLAAGLFLLILRPGGRPAPAKGTVRVQPGIASLRVSGSF